MSIFKTMKKDLREVCYFGEEGSMAVFCKTKRGAWIKFRQKVREDCGDSDAEDVSMDDIVVGYVHAATPEEIEEYGDESEYFISTKHKENSLQVWYYSI